LPGYLPGTMSIISHHARHITLPSLSGRDIVIMLICAAILAVLAVLPVLGDKLFDTVTPKATKASPITFCLGLAALLVGLFTRIWVLDITGACLIGAVILGALLINY
jgi:hypothetical protein